MGILLGEEKKLLTYMYLLKDWAILEAGKTGGGGGDHDAPPLQISAVDCVTRGIIGTHIYM